MSWLAKFVRPVVERLRLPEMMKLRGARLPVPPDEDAAAAVQRCEQCEAKGFCDAYLAAANPQAYRGFCPNAAYIESRREKSRSLT